LDFRGALEGRASPLSRVFEPGRKRSSPHSLYWLVACRDESAPDFSQRALARFSSSVAAPTRAPVTSRESTSTRVSRAAGPVARGAPAAIKTLPCPRAEAAARLRNRAARRAEGAGTEEPTPRAKPGRSRHARTACRTASRPESIAAVRVRPATRGRHAIYRAIARASFAIVGSATRRRAPIK